MNLWLIGLNYNLYKRGFITEIVGNVLASYFIKRIIPLSDRQLNGAEVNIVIHHEFTIGYVAQLPAEDPAHLTLSWRDPRGWTIPWGRPQASCLRQMESYLKDTGMTGLAAVWAMARWRPKKYRRKVDAATRCSGVYPHTWPTWIYPGRLRSANEIQDFPEMHSIITGKPWWVAFSDCV